MTSDRWWEQSVGYEVYLRSFADGDGDGVGDLRGLIDRLDHLAALGVDIVWVTPFYPSPMHDHGYDVADYRDVDPAFGSLADVDRLVERAHALGLRVLIDLVPNHTSSEHPWFRAARASRDSPFRDRYIWRDPAPDGGPPNNWASHFGGPAWTLDEATGQYYLHLFLPEQPDLNWDHPAVVEEFDDILRFWFSRGVDGFRIDVAHALVKHPDLPDLPLAGEAAVARLAATGAPGHRQLEHIYDQDQPGVLHIYRRWRKIADEHGALLLGEVYLLDAADLARYLVEQDGLHASFWFAPLHIGWDAQEIRAVVESAASAIPRGLAWVLSSHDRVRPVTRFGGGAVGRRRALALSTLLMGLPGTPFLYQGEELGLDDGVVDRGEAEDPIAVRGGAFEASRDGCRTPMPWAPEPGLGFTTASQAWLPWGGRAAEDTVAVQQRDPDAPLHRYRALVALRRREPDLHAGELRWLLETGDVIAFERGAIVVAANCGDAVAEVDLPVAAATILFATERAREAEHVHGTLRLGPAEAVVLRDAELG